MKGKILKGEIVGAGLTLRAVAQKAGLRYAVLSEICNGWKEASPNEMSAIRQAILNLTGTARRTSWNGGE